MESFWEEVVGATLRQGDYLLNCPVPVFQELSANSEQQTFPVRGYDLIIVTQGRWEEVRKGRIEALHLLSSPINPANNREALLADFREIYSLPFEFLTRHAAAQGKRWRLRSPYLEHFSQAFARFFMRVGLPAAIPPFK